MVVLPDHLHCIWRLPENDDDFSTRWRLIKHYFSRAHAGDAGALDVSRRSKDEKALWQRRFWEHLIRGEEDWRRHMDYVHYNPVKHGYVAAPVDWPYSTFARSVKKGWYPPDWGTKEPDSIRDLVVE